MNLFRRKHWLLTALGVSVLAVSVHADNFSPGSKVNVLRQYDLTDMSLLTTVNWTVSPGTSLGTPYAPIDGGHTLTQNAGSTDWAQNWGYIDITLPAAVSISSIYTAFHDHPPAQFRVLGSATGFTFNNTTDVLVDWTAGSGRLSKTYDLTSNTTVQYLRLEYSGTLVSQYFQLSEIMAFAANPTAIGLADGYNIMANKLSTPIVAKSGWQDAEPNNVFNTDSFGYLRPLNGDNTSYFIKDLGEVITLCAGSYSFFHGQGWDNTTIQVTTKDWETATDADWKTIFLADAVSGGHVFQFAPIDARYIRVTHNGAATGALTSLEFFAAPPVPEPVTLSLLTLGGLTMLRRRK